MAFLSLFHAARKNNALVLTDDFPLNGMCKKIGINSIHINEILSQKEIFEKILSHFRQEGYHPVKERIHAPRLEIQRPSPMELSNKTFTAEYG